MFDTTTQQHSPSKMMVGRPLSFFCVYFVRGLHQMTPSNYVYVLHPNNFKQTHVQTQTLKQSTNHEGPPKKTYPKAKPPGNSKE